MKLTLPLTCLLSLAPALGFAQEPAQRDSIEHFRDSLSTLSDTLALVDLESFLIDRARVDRDNAVLHIKLGFLALRMADLGSTSRYDDAGSEFEWAIDLQPEWPYPWLGLGFTEQGDADSTYGVRTRLRAVFGRDPLTLASNALIHSVATDSTFVPALTALVNVSSRQMLNARPDEVLEILRRAAGTPAGQSLEFLLARGRMERDLGYDDSAAVAFQKYLDKGGSHDLGTFELARSLLAGGHLEAQKLYYEAAGSRDSFVIANLRRDVALIAGDSGVARFDSAGQKGRVEFLARFWTQRDRYDLRQDGERLAEHYRRLYFARQHFRRIARRRLITGRQEYIPKQLDFDARGEIYVRHGEPTERVDAPDFCAVSWRYARGDGDLIFHFAGNPAENSYELVSRVLDICTPEILWLSRVHTWSPLYAKLVNAPPNSESLFVLNQELAAVRDIKEGVASDRYELTYGNTLPASSQVVAVGRADGGSLVHFAIAIPGEYLKPDTINGVISYRMRTRIVVLSRTGQVLASSDLARRHRTDAVIPKGQFLTLRDTLSVPPGMATYRIAVEQDSSNGGIFPRDSLLVGRFGFGGDSLALSDLVLGSRGANLAWLPTREDTVFFNPLGSFRERSSMELYYEVYGLRFGTTYSTRLSVRREGRDRAELTLDFSDPAGGDVTRSRRTVDLTRLRRGEYLIDVVVTAADGRTVRQRRGFRVVKE
ncbi:MAG: GWxTD domain-containing protein [Gemmatimonadota bacterium]